MNKEYSNNFIERITQIELECNKIKRSYDKNKDNNVLQNANICKIMEMIDNNEVHRKDLEFVEKHLIKRGFVFKDGQPNYSALFKIMDISSSSYSKFKYGEQMLKWNTALKLVLGLRLSEEEANEYLSSIGYNFKCWDKIDILILAYIRKDYFGDQRATDIKLFVYDMIEYYNEMYISSHMKPLKNLF